MKLASDVARECGIVGAGGAGFPTHVKLQAKADTLLVNAAECEPLLYKDQEILEHHMDEFAAGAVSAARCIGAKRVAVCIKEKHGELSKKMAEGLPKGFEVTPLRDAYPSGDEFVLTYEATGRCVPRGGLPLDVGVVVNNVETLYNIGIGRPLTEKFVTVSGELEEAVTLKVPIGTSLRSVLQAAGADTGGRGFIVGGPMMGYVCGDLDEPVTKLTAGVLVLPGGHPLLAKKARTAAAVRKITYSCDQCTRCSDLCPRDLLGHFVKPHRAMTSISFSPGESTAWQESALYCCECALCTLYSCPEDLDPYRVMAESKRRLLSMGLRPEKGDVETSAMYRYRRTPTAMLVRRLGLEPYIRPHSMKEIAVKPRKMTYPLKQHIGAPSIPAVKQGQVVSSGTLLADIPDGQLGSRIFASAPGTVKLVGPSAIEVAPN